MEKLQFFWLLPVKTKLYNSYLTFPRQTLMKVFNFPVKNTSSGIGTFKAASIAALAAAAVFVYPLLLFFFIFSRSEKAMAVMFCVHDCLIVYLIYVSYSLNTE